MEMVKTQSIQVVRKGSHKIRSRWLKFSILFHFVRGDMLPSVLRVQNSPGL